MMSVISGDNNRIEYPPQWLRWVRQQVMTAVAYELAAAHPERGPQLRRLPLSTDPAHGTPELFLRQLIGRHARRCPVLPARERAEWIADAVLAEPGVSVAEPELTEMLAWHFARSAVPVPGKMGADDDDVEYGDHECFDPERLAADLVASGLVAAAWRSFRPGRIAGGGTGDPRAAQHRAGRPRRRRHPATAPEQLHLPFPGLTGAMDPLVDLH